MRPPDRLSFYEELILAALDEQKAAGIHGLGISESIQTMTAGEYDLGGSTLYPALKKLERLGLIGGRWESLTVARAAGRPRRQYWRITPKGVAMLDEARHLHRVRERALFGRPDRHGAGGSGRIRIGGSG